ncbi:Flp pilus assembly protein CpaB [Microvirga sp. M2]|uniref:Flp pilus assembly protein CpaB n=1 Tax=Microvirga sp. M2 TaxID=3073270 RepID=UPI0039C1F7F9
MLRIIILTVALSAGGACAWLLTASKPAQTEVAKAAPMNTTEILVASADLSPGQVVGEKDLRWQAWPKDAVSAAYLTRAAKPDAPASFKGQMVRGRIVSGEPILEDKFSRSASGILASMLPAGKRAVAIRVSAESAAGGFILPNDRVDVIHTPTQIGQKGDTENLGKTILTNIRILAIDQKAEDAKSNAAVIGKTATLELNADQAETIAAAQATGTLFLALRSATDGDDTPAVRRANVTSIQVFLGEKNEKVRVQ